MGGVKLTAICCKKFRCENCERVHKMFYLQSFLHKIKHTIKVVGSRNFAAMATGKSHRVAVCQMQSTNDRDNNFNQVKNLVEKARDGGAEVSRISKDLSGKSLWEAIRFNFKSFLNLFSLSSCRNVATSWEKIDKKH